MDTIDATRFSRRAVIRIAGVSGLAVAIAGVGSPRPLAALAADLHDETLEGFLAAAYTQRANAMSTGDTSLLDQVYDPSSVSLLAFEKDRTAFFYRGLGTRWDGSILGYRALVSLLDLKQSGSTATARLYEATNVTWIPNPRPAPTKEALSRRLLIAPFVTPTGPHGEIVSAMGRRHEVTLTQGATGWRLARDAYDESDQGWRSPDLMPGSWAEIQWGGPTGIVASAPAPSSPRPYSTYYYNPISAANYAVAYVTPYNGSYCNYNNCGGDCTNFVSQCLRAGGEINGGSWYTFSGGCGTCGTSSSNAGTDTWANNVLLHNWLQSSGRGGGASWITSCIVGDVVNYYTSSMGWHHMTIITDDRNYLVTSHNPDLYNVPWNSAAFNATNWWFTNVWEQYQA